MRVLIACVGYRYLRDQSVGPALVPILNDVDWPEEIEVCDLHFGPIHMVQWLETQPDYYDRIVFVAAVERGREPGRVYRYQWDRVLPDAEEIQRRIEEGVTGVISLDNLLIIGQYFNVFPSDVRVVEVEPEDTGWGPGFSPRIEGALDEIIATIRRAALEGDDG